MKWLVLFLDICLVVFCGWYALSSYAQSDTKKIIVALNATYPPFEFIQNEKIVGFDVDLAKSIGKIAGYEIEIKDMNFDSIVSAIQTGRADVGISAMTITPERLKNVDFSERYYIPKLAMLYSKKMPIKSANDLEGKTIATQLGTTMESFLREEQAKGKKFKIVVWKKTHVMINELKLDRVQGVLVEESQAKTFAQLNPGMLYSILPNENYTMGYAIALKKGSNLKKEIDIAIKNLKKSGEIHKLERNWLNKNITQKNSTK